MLNIKKELEELTKASLEKLGLESEVHLEHPEDLSFGDFSTNVAMVLAKSRQQNPKLLAEDIRTGLPESELVSKTEVAGPGFINFYLSDKFLKESVKSINEDFGKLEIHKGKNILVEHSSPNLFKPFHIGHMMNNTIGESIVRLAEFSGAKVTKIAFPSDISLGIAKTVWVLKNRGGKEYLAKHKEKLDQEIMGVFGEAYAEGTKAFEDNEEVQKEVREVYKKIVTDKSSEEFEIYKIGKDLNLSYFEHVVHRFGSKFDAFIFESEAGEAGEKIVRENTPKVFTESEGAVVYEGESKGLHTRVFINKEGYPTYEAKDVGLLSLKFGKYNPDISLFVTDDQQAEYFKVVVSAAGEIHPEWKEKTIHRTHGRMSFKGAKMSSRLGNVPLATDILDTVHDEALTRMQEKNSVLADQISLSALKFTILKTAAGKNINFDPETSLSFEGDSGPYLQYTFARCNSLLEKAKSEGFEMSEEPKKGWTAGELEKILYRFSEVTEESIANWAPHHVATYLLELARTFNSWYANTKVLDEENENAGFYLTLVEKTSKIIKNGLYLLGIESPEKM